MREPAFWWKRGSGRLLVPLAGLYGAAAAWRMHAEGQRAGVPVVCLGNLTVGGAGKTPAAIAVARLLLAARARPFFLTRGYGGRLPDRCASILRRMAQPMSATSRSCLARLAPTIVARERVAGAAMARRDGATVIVMDDGFQNPSLVKDLVDPRGRRSSRHRQRPGRFRPVPCARRSTCRWRARTPLSWSARRPMPQRSSRSRAVTA